MALTNCPMCSSSVENVVAVKSCMSCGADLSRWMPRAATPPPIPAIAMQEAVELGVAPRRNGEFNLSLGVIGAVGGAIAGMGLMYGFYATTGFRFPLLGCGTGLLSGIAARWLFKGTAHTLGIISAIASVVGVVGALVMMYGVDFSPLNVFSIVASASVAYKIATR